MEGCTGFADAMGRTTIRKASLLAPILEPVCKALLRSEGLPITPNKESLNPGLGGVQCLLQIRHDREFQLNRLTSLVLLLSENKHAVDDVVRTKTPHIPDALTRVEEKFVGQPRRRADWMTRLVLLALRIGP